MFTLDNKTVTSHQPPQFTACCRNLPQRQSSQWRNVPRVAARSTQPSASIYPAAIVRRLRNPPGRNCIKIVETSCYASIVFFFFSVQNVYRDTCRIVTPVSRYVLYRFTPKSMRIELRGVSHLLAISVNEYISLWQTMLIYFDLVFFFQKVCRQA